MKKLFLIITVLFGLVASVNAEAKKLASFEYNDKYYCLAIDTTRSYIEFEGIKFQPLEFHKTFGCETFSIKEATHDSEIDYIIVWRGLAWVTTNSELYNIMLWTFDNMVKQKNNPKALVQLSNYGDSVMEEYFHKRSCKLHILGYYENGKFITSSYTWPTK